MLSSPAAALPAPLTAPLPAEPLGPGGGGTVAAEGPSFRDVLSALNPLQYLPVVGTIYRAVTGDVVAEPLRSMGSMLAGGLMGGPIGVAMSAASSLLQHVSGLDLDGIAHTVLASMGLVDDAAPTTALASAAASPPSVAMPPSPAGSATAAEASLAAGTAPITLLAPADMALRQTALAAYGQTLFTYGPARGHA